jgi:hypothetical protein
MRGLLGCNENCFNLDGTAEFLRAWIHVGAIVSCVSVNAFNNASATTNDYVLMPGHSCC